MTTDLVRPGLEPAFDVTAHLAELHDHGVTRAGHRRVIGVAGGRVTGGIEAEILPGGADWQIVRADGAVEIDGRYSARTSTGALMYLQVVGIRTGPTTVLEGLLRGDPTPPSAYYFRTSIRIETSDPELAHLEHSLYIASCARAADTVRYRAYRVT